MGLSSGGKAVPRLGRLGQNGGMARPAIDLMKLSTDEKLELIDELWNSLREGDLPLSNEVRAELDRRLDMERGDAEAVPWDEVRAEMIPSKP